MDVHRMSHQPGAVLKSSQVLVPAVAAVYSRAWTWTWGKEPP
jgi:hypothetical protein